MGVWVVGSLNLDILLAVDALPRPGETILARGPVLSPGGKGANQAAAAARMGAATAMVGAVGDDPAGAALRSALGDAGVALGALRTKPGHATGTAYIAVEAAGENQVIVASGANAALAPDDLPGATSGVLLAQLETPTATLAAAFSRHSGPRILNAAPAEPAAAALFGEVDVLIVNQHELAVYLGTTVSTDVEQLTAARALISRDEGAVIVTLGAGGAAAVWRDRVLHAPAAHVVPVDTVGAGDCFCGALAALLDEGRSIAAALPLANAAAALCTLAPGALPAMPTRAAADAFLEASQQNMRGQSRTAPAGA